MIDKKIKSTYLFLRPTNCKLWSSFYTLHKNGDWFQCSFRNGAFYEWYQSNTKVSKYDTGIGSSDKVETILQFPQGAHLILFVTTWQILFLISVLLQLNAKIDGPITCPSQKGKREKWYFWDQQWIMPGIFYGLPKIQPWCLLCFGFNQQCSMEF